VVLDLKLPWIKTFPEKLLNALPKQHNPQNVIVFVDGPRP
jgi:hypothetical protein